MVQGLSNMSGSKMNESDRKSEELSTSLKFEERVAHLKTGYDNSQSVVRFLDTKASAVIGAIPIVIAALTGLFGAVKDLGRWEQAFKSDYGMVLWAAALLTIAVSVVLLVFAVLAIVAAFSAITPRNTGEAKPSVIFPFESSFEFPTPDQSFAARVKHFKEKATQNDALEDYERQIVRMSEIVRQKLTCVNTAVKELKVFFIFAVILLGLLCGTTVLAGVLASQVASNATAVSTPSLTPLATPTPQSKPSPTPQATPTSPVLLKPAPAPGTPLPSHTP